ncbi:MAG: molybdopterin-guanine dinucleotide biosynthesis protein A [Rhodospirillales bacterium]|nr:molybdopterin-guanine dinucleotide biosynthesis protein A [Rhodospirillales bacterium]
MRPYAALGLPALAIFVVFALAAPASADDRHEGYYYPKPRQVEIYEARSRVLEESDRRRRVGFIVAVVNDMLRRPYPPPLSVFVKGGQAEKLIIVSNVDGRLNTVYRVRAYLATLTASARATPIFQEYEVEDWFTFLDLAKMLGFERITISDGDAFAHQILLK